MPRILPPPNFRSSFKQGTAKIIMAMAKPEVVAFVQEHNNAYTPWDKLRHLEPPAGLTAKQAWVCIKFSRIQQYRELPFTDVRGQPFRYWLPDSVLQLLHRIDQQCSGTLESQSRLLTSNEENERYLVTSLMEEAIASSVIEGAVTTRVEAKRMLKQGRRPRTDSEQMIVNNYAAIQQLGRLRNGPLSVSMLNNLHRVVTRDTLDNPDQAGRFQKPGEDRVGVVNINDGEMVHRPPPAGELDDRMQQIIQFANEKQESRFHHPVVRSILLHFAIAYVHPYVDGNGRTARAAFYWSMLHQGYWLAQYLTVSNIIRKAPIQYHSAFKHAELDDADATYFLLYHLRVIERAIASFTKYVSRKREELESTTQMLEKHPLLNYRQRALLAHAIRKTGVFYTFASHAKSHNVSYLTARSDLRRLVKWGLLEELGGLPIQFVPAPNLHDLIGQSSG